MTKFSFEVPIPHLKDFEDLQDFFFTLSFLYADDTYKRFYMEKIQEGLKTVWLDNSYNEKLKADDCDLLMIMAKQLGVQKVIVPDDPKWGTTKIIHSLKQARSMIHPGHLITVVSSRTMASALTLAGAHHLAYSYWNRKEVPIEKRMWAKDCHFLGMLELEELIRIKPPSCDTSMPIKMALKGWNVGAWQMNGSPHIYTHELPDFFTTTLTKGQIALARDNIKHIKEAVNG
jgi:hypothetical protein